MVDQVRLQILKGPVTTSPVSRAVVDALVEAQVTEAAGQRGGFQLKFRLDKGGELERELENGGFEPATRVQLIAIVNGVPNVLVDGVIARNDLAISVTPGESTLSITGSDLTQMMDLIDFTGIPLPMPAEAQVALLLAKYAMYGVIPGVIPSPMLLSPNPLDRFPSQQGTDLAHIKSLASTTGYVFYVEPVGPGVNLAYWGPEIRVGSTQPALSVDMGPASNVDSLSISFDGMAKTQFVGWVQPKESPIPIPIPVPDFILNPPLGSQLVAPRRLKQINRAQSPGTDDATSKRGPVEAAMLALSRASRSANVITASGGLDVARYGRLLRARKLVAVRGVGHSHDGDWFVRSVTTTIARGQMQQSFSLDRNAFKPSSTTAPVG